MCNMNLGRSQLAHFAQTVNLSRHMPGQRFQLHVTARAGRPHVAYLRRKLRAAHVALNPPLAELSVALVGDAEMSHLHEQFLKIAGPTDVLTFPLDLDRRGRPLSGEVVVCVPEARRQARQSRTPVEQELLLYALHGMLHLCGFDDRTAAGFKQMHRTEDQILTRLGVGPVFDPAPAIAARSSRSLSRHRRHSTGDE
jgi:probable rRNA maturation factor